jgi:hypothetical protein
VVSPNLCSEDVGECLARHLPSRLSTRITRNPVVRGMMVLATVCKSFEGEEVNKEKYILVFKTLKREEKYK